MKKPKGGTEGDDMTTCMLIRTPCCKAEVFLVQRGHDDDDLVWTGVPCMSCDKTWTYSVSGNKSHGSMTTPTELGADLISSGWSRCADIWPAFKRMHCWASR